MADKIINTGKAKMNKNGILNNVSFITTVFNEAGSIRPFLESLAAQAVLPFEIIIVDGGSEDGTYEIILSFFRDLSQKDFKAENLKAIRKNHNEGAQARQLHSFESRIYENVKVLALQVPGTRISQGRNIAIEKASGKLICVSDAGCILEKDWIGQITIPLLQDPDFCVMGGYNYPLADKFLQACLAVCIIPKKTEIKAESFMPSSRNICFLKSAWEKAGRYPEEMDYGEDMKFNFNLKAGGFKIGFNPAAHVYWNLRSSLCSIFKQFFRYAKGDAVGRMYPKRHLLRFLSLAALAVIIAASAIVSPYFIIALFILFAVYSFRPYTRINYVIDNPKISVFIKSRKNALINKFMIAFLIPLLLIYIDTAKLSGYIYGFLFKKNKK